MSIALRSGGGRCGATCSPFNFHPHPPRFISTPALPFMAMYGASDPPIGAADSGSGTSSIGKNSDLSASDPEVDDAGDDEAQSGMTTSPLDSMNSLHQVLPFKKGLSKYFDGETVSLHNLAEASSMSSINDLAKPEIPSHKKRKKFSLTPDRVSKHSRSGPYYRPQASEASITLGSLAAIPLSETNSCDKSNLCSSSSLNRLPPSTKGSSPGIEVTSPPSEQSILSSRPHSVVADLQSASGSGASLSSVSTSPPSAGASLQSDDDASPRARR